MKKFSIILISIFTVIILPVFANAIEGTIDFYKESREVIISGNAGEENANKSVTLLLTDTNAVVSSLSDDEIGYIGQTSVLEDGNYTFKFKLKENKKIEDYNAFVTLGNQDITSTLKSASYKVFKNYATKIDIVHDSEGIAVNSVVKIIDDSDDFMLENYNVIVAYYGLNSTLLSVTKEEVQISQSEKNITLQIPEGALLAKAFIWADYEKLVPISDIASVDCETVTEGSYDVLFPGWRYKALTLSYDDGGAKDGQLAEIFNTYGIKASFNLIKNDTYDYQSWYSGHEVAAHSDMYMGTNETMAQNLGKQVETVDACIAEITDAKARVVEKFGDCNGFIWPYGAPDSERKTALMPTIKALYDYARPTTVTNDYSLPEDWYNWEVTCIQNTLALDEENTIINGFLEESNELMLLNVRGHSYEFDSDSYAVDWDYITSFAKSMGENDAVWKATNYDVYEYVNAMRKITLTDDGRLYNPSNIDLYVKANGRNVLVEANGYAVSNN